MFTNKELELRTAKTNPWHLLHRREINLFFSLLLRRMKLGREHGVNEAFTHLLPQLPASFNPVLLPKSRGPGSLPSQMLGTQPAPAGWRPLPPGASPLMVGRGCWPSHRYPEAGQAGAPPWPCGWLHLQEDNCPARGGQPHWRLSLLSGLGAAWVQSRRRRRI